MEIIKRDYKLVELGISPEDIERAFRDLVAQELQTKDFYITDVVFCNNWGHISVEIWPNAKLLPNTE